MRLVLIGCNVDEIFRMGSKFLNQRISRIRGLIISPQTPFSELHQSSNKKKPQPHCFIPIDDGTWGSSILFFLPTINMWIFDEQYQEH